MSTDVWEEEATVAVAIIPMEEIAIPVAPKRLARPAVPVAAIDIDEDGRVVEASIGVSSGYRRLDEAALVSIPLEFRVRN